MRRPLTARQHQILGLICDHVDQRGYPPSVRDLVQALGLASTNGVHEQLSILVKKGWLVRERGVARGLRVLHRPPKAA